MDSLKWREILIAVVFVVGVVFLLPTFTPNMPPWWTKVLPKDKIHLGLDLQGGMHLILEVEAEKAVESTAERLAEDLKESLRTQKIPFTAVSKTGKHDIEINLPAAEQQNDVRQLIEKNYPTLKWVEGSTSSEGSKVLLTLQDSEVQRIEKNAVAQGLETIRNRIDQFGVSEPDIRPETDDRILVQLPGIKDPQGAVNIIGKTALLEFKLVADNVTPQEIKDNKLPPGVKVYPQKQHMDRNGAVTNEGPIALQDRTLMTGEYISNAQVRLDSQYGSPYIALDFDAQGARLFDRITEANVKKRLAIVLDGVVYSSPVIQERIGGGHATITGHFTMEEAKDIALVLRAGALPAPVKILEQRTVGPSLGRDSIHKGVVASIVASLLIVIFMVVYYRMAGFIADVALILNIILVLAAMAAIGATLTLPGIAGIALIIGIAVDANVLIYERIREELRLGKTPKAAVDTGYGRATLTILDANITTLIAAAVLFQFGTGPIKGFAVTLSIGLVANLYTAIIVTRSIFDYMLLQRRVKTLSI